MTRKALSKRTRFEVFKRDGFKCCYCGHKPPDVVLVVDHVVPVAKGGGDEPENLVTACFVCNAGKGAVPLGVIPPALDEEAIAEAMQEVAERRLALEGFYAEQVAYQQDIGAVVEQVELLWQNLLSHSDSTIYNGFERRSITNFVRRGLSLREFENAIAIVSESWTNGGPRSGDSLWRHFCKLCWDAIRASGVDW